jgi:hypothetical protein
MHLRRSMRWKCGSDFLYLSPCGSSYKADLFLFKAKDFYSLISGFKN